MIKVEKIGVAPSKLATDGNIKAADHCAEYDADPNTYKLGTKTFVIDRNIYNLAKKKLRKIQHDKCCYCESLVPAKKTSHADVEHFRPKIFVQQMKGAEKEYPGYYWLAYDWDNLFLSCQVCNGSYKRNFFPLDDPGTRARSHHDSIGNEIPLLVNPAGPEDPRDHIKFEDEVPVGQSPKGCRMIETLDLRRLNDERKTLLDQLKLYTEIIKTWSNSQESNVQKMVRSAKSFLKKATIPEAEYSSMAIDYCHREGICTINL